VGKIDNHTNRTCVKIFHFHWTNERIHHGHYYKVQILAAWNTLHTPSPPPHHNHNR
jgi:hypothetical protein